MEWEEDTAAGSGHLNSQQFSQFKPIPQSFLLIQVLYKHNRGVSRSVQSVIFECTLSNTCWVVSSQPPCSVTSGALLTVQLLHSVALDPVMGLEGRSVWWDETELNIWAGSTPLPQGEVETHNRTCSLSHWLTPKRSNSVVWGKCCLVPSNSSSFTTVHMLVSIYIVCFCLPSIYSDIITRKRPNHTQV